ncbi:MAG: hypothetical protein AAFQ79_08315 [Pseudomonadota bacterium]
MQAIMRRIPSQDDLHRNRAKLAGFGAGIVVPLAVAAFFNVTFTGYGLSEEPTPPPVIYPNW